MRNDENWFVQWVAVEQNDLDIFAACVAFPVGMQDSWDCDHVNCETTLQAAVWISSALAGVCFQNGTVCQHCADMI